MRRKIRPQKTLLALLALVIGTAGVSARPAIASEERKVKINWREVKDAVKYDFQLAKNPEMDPLLDRKTYSSTQISLKLAPGTYYFRVRGLDNSEAPGPWSEVQGFVVNQAPPDLRDPDDGEDFKELLPEEGISFEWKSGLKGTRYLLEVSDRKGVVYKRNVNGTDYRWKPPKAGQYQWRVGIETATGGEDWGKSRKFSVAPTAFEQPKTQIIEKVVEKVIEKDGKKIIVSQPAGNGQILYEEDESKPRPPEWWILGRMAQSVVAYSAQDQDSGVNGSGAALAGLYSVELRWRAGKQVGQQWVPSAAVNFEMIRQSVLSTDFSLPRFNGRFFYGKERGNWKLGPFAQLGFGQSGIFIVQSETSALTATVTRLSLGLGGSALYRPAPSFALSALGLIRMDTGGSSPTLPSSLSSSIGYEIGFGAGVSLGPALLLEGRLRVLSEAFKWTPANGSGTSSLTDTFIILDGGVGFKF